MANFSNAKLCIFVLSSISCVVNNIFFHIYIFNMKRFLSLQLRCLLSSFPYPKLPRVPIVLYYYLNPPITYICRHHSTTAAANATAAITTSPLVDQFLATKNKKVLKMMQPTKNKTGWFKIVLLQFDRASSLNVVL